MKTLQFWLEYGSTYSYLSVARIGSLASARDIEIEWCPFYLLPIFTKLGMNYGPFLPYPNKMEYMWRDIERRAQRLSLPYRKPSAYPIDSLPTARIACIASTEGWCQAFTEEVFRLHWTEGKLIGTDENLDTVLVALGHDPAAMRARAQMPETKDALRRQTERAEALKIFGSPSFVVGDELFWGDDRLEEAIDWASGH
ncbi:MAG: 2-hydroxychromene-2-carboxylate isomerase [Burkholderiaceae bacterium]|jgi:2-hydroxychromene-2-carboxylate isomerase|nr:2-hydroxychromene-2-carboxylate isomerase [Burkholderiaceae bacterium]MEB2317572.1 2-hydroxychromene-2-carboxylate isomerase [Pseudomonadota bacterium]